MPQLTGSQMKYLHVIYKTQNDVGSVRSIDISKGLGVTKASVSRMIKLLSNKGLISMENSGVIEFTPEGKSEVMEIDRKYIGVYFFFADYLGLNSAEAQGSTYSFLCGFSEDCVGRLAGKQWVTEGI